MTETAGPVQTCMRIRVANLRILVVTGLRTDLNTPPPEDPDPIYEQW